MKILVTGSAGFIGRHLYRAYALEHEVVGLDKQPHTDIRLDLVHATVSELVDVLRHTQVVNHHAAQIDVRYSLADPVHDAENNIIATLKLLEAAKQAGVRRFIFASSSGAIGDTEYPTTPYGIAKLTIEKYLYFYSAFMNTVSLRYSNVYGPFQQTGIVSTMFTQALKDKTVVINGDGMQTRDFIFIDDVISANQVSLHASPDTYTIATGNATNILELLAHIHQLTPVHHTHAPTIAGEVRHSAPLPKGPLTWNPLTSLEEGLQKTFEYYRSVY